MAYEPKRIAHYPNDIIDIITAGSVNAAVTRPVSVSALSSQMNYNRNSTHTAQQYSVDNMDRLMSTLSLQSMPNGPMSPHAQSSAISPSHSPLQSPSRSTSYSTSHSTLHSTPSSLTATRHGSYQTMSLARPMAALSSIASDITHIQHQLNHSTNQQSIHHQQLLERLVQLLQEHAEAKERDERVLAELAAAKERDEEMHNMQRQTIERLVVAQQHLEAILVQNYELHEFPIPRLFVILPDSYEKWDPRSFLAERFRLFFLCECGDHCDSDATTPTSSGQLTITAADNTAPIAVKNTIHLAKHEGYELSRPTEFFDRYGPYVLGMLRILKHCLAVATVVAPAVALAENSVKDAMDGVRSIAESTMKAVDMSIDFLEGKLEDETMEHGDSNIDADAQDEEDMFSGLAALEGADLRRLDSFLRNKDTDKILGNLYRITTDTGHVKWVCLDHYRQVYRKTTMASFLQCVASNDGVYDPQRGKVVISLKSSIAAKDFFSRLAQHGSAVTTLEVTFDWSFSTSDVATLVDKVAHSNVRDVSICFIIRRILSTIGLLMRPGKGRYHSLLSLFSNTKIKGLGINFIDTNLIGLQTSTLPTSNSPSLLQSFRFEASIVHQGDSQIADIISHCPHLVDLRLGSIVFSSIEVPKIEQAISSLSKLTTLHRCRLNDEHRRSAFADNIGVAPYGHNALRGLVDIGLPHPTGPGGLLEEAILRSSATLEVLFLQQTQEHVAKKIDLVETLRPLLPSTERLLRVPFPKLTHLELTVELTPASLELMAAMLPLLPLAHLSVLRSTCSLMSHADLGVLKSLRFEEPDEDALEAFASAVFRSSSCVIESLYIISVKGTPDLVDFLGALDLKKLHIEYVRNTRLCVILERLKFTQLQVLTVVDSRFTREEEEMLAERSAEFVDGFVLQRLDDEKPSTTFIHEERTKGLKGSPSRLARYRVRLMRHSTFHVEHYTSSLPSFSV
ncbi:hypothetical protein EC991_001080 [Linnemannia zychae]|nr:hypothetical protein EC991_001080 [Linnemannia zychae]